MYMYTRIIGAILVIALLAAGVFAYGEYRRSNAEVPEPVENGVDLSRVYQDTARGFSITFPEGIATTSVGYAENYTVDASYEYEAQGPGEEISGVKFTIPAALAEGTNLSSDSYLSVEWLPAGTGCDAEAFLGTGATSEIVSDGGVEYSTASASDAGAGNRYEETIYAVQGTDPCIAIRYFVHYTAIQNYPEGAVREFDHEALVEEFDAIRATLTLTE